LKLLRKLSTTIKYSYLDNGKKVKGRVRAFLPQIDQLERYTKEICSEMDLDELSYLSKMTKFSIVFPVEKNEYVDYQEMMRCGLILKNSHISPIENSEVKSLFYNALKGSYLEVNMTEYGYYAFRDMVLEELESYDNWHDEMFNKAYKDNIRKLSMTKRLRLLTKKKKIDKIKEELRKDSWSMITSTANADSNKIAENNFPKRAFELLENFDNKKYKDLIQDVIIEFEMLSSDGYREVIQRLNDGGNQKKKEDILEWIIDNTCSIESAFENIKREADYINKEIIYKYCMNYYKIHMKEMNREEKRLYQLCFFRRKEFQYRIPVFDDFMRSFWKENMQIIFTGLVLKGINPDYKQDNKMLEEKWKEFLSIYPYALNNRNLYNHLKDAKKIKEMINRNYNGTDLSILHAFVDGYEIETIQAQYGCSKKYCLELIERYKKDAKYQDETINTI
jgi:hypothetical protein